MTLLFSLFLVLRLQAAEVILNPGEVLQMKPGQETTVICKNAGKPGDVQNCDKGVGSDESCHGLSHGSLCRKDDVRGLCIGMKTMHGFQCKCIPN
jgi:hypothetical protein